MNFITAAGKTPCNSAVKASLPGMDNAMTQVMLLNDTPPLLSVGKRVQDEGTSFFWIAGKMPCLVTKRGKVIPLKAQGRLPLGQLIKSRTELYAT